MAKYLDETGLQHLWSKIEDKFVDNDELSLSANIVEATEDSKITINGEEKTSGKFIKFTWDAYAAKDPVYIALNDINEQEVLTETIKPLGVTVGNINSDTELTPGMTLTQILKQMLIKEIDVKATLPSVTLTISGDPKNDNFEYEIGSTVNITLSRTYTDGKYTGLTGYSYTHAAQCEAVNTEYYHGNTKLDGNTHELKVSAKTTTYKCKTSYAKSSFTPIKNNGVESDVTITAGTCESQLKTIYGYYKYFFGIANYTTPAAFVADETSTGGKTVSEKIRDLLTVKSGFVKNNATVNGKSVVQIIGENAITVNDNDDNKGSIILAIPSTCKFEDVQYSLGASMLPNFSEKIDIQYIFGDSTTNYTIYMFPMTNPTEVSIKNLIITQ